jgi:hypothetical protein
MLDNSAIMQRVHRRRQQQTGLFFGHLVSFSAI